MYVSTLHSRIRDRVEASSFEQASQAITTTTSIAAELAKLANCGTVLEGYKPVSKTLVGYVNKTDRVPVAVYADGKQLDMTPAMVVSRFGKPVENAAPRSGCVYVSPSPKPRRAVLATTREAAQPAGVLAEGMWVVLPAGSLPPVAIIENGQLIPATSPEFQAAQNRHRQLARKRAMHARPADKAA